jgi:hypothetical protein
MKIMQFNQWLCEFKWTAKNVGEAATLSANMAECLPSNPQRQLLECNVLNPA